MNANGYITAAVARSFRNMGDAAASPQELLGVLSRLFAGYYGEAADQNPAVFARRTVNIWTGTGWDAPLDQYAVYRITWNGVPVVIVPFDDPQADTSVPAIYRLGSQYFPAGNPNDPVGTNLIWFYQPVPPAFASVLDDPPTEWPQQFDERVICDLATYLAEKDGRPDDLAAMQREAAKWASLYSQWLAIADVNTVRRFSLPTQVPTPSVKPIGVQSS